MTRATLWLRRVGMILCAAVALNGCGKGPQDSTGSASPSQPGDTPAVAAARKHAAGPPRQLEQSDLTPSEQRYGIAPIPDSTVTYQPDVIVVGGGADNIRAQSPNGFIWTIDANAPHASELATGKVMFMTNRAVGRVLDVRKEGDALVVVIGPIDLTDLIREAHIRIDDIPIDFAQALSYGSPEWPGKAVSMAQVGAPPATASPAMFLRTQGTPPAADEAPDVSKLVNFKTHPFANKQGLGVRVTSDGGGLKVSAQAYVGLEAPKLRLVLDITPSGGVTESSFELTGAAGLTWQFSAGTDVGRSANVQGLLQPDIDFSIPVGGLGPVPLAVTIRQRFQIQTALGVRNSTIGATGAYTFTGGFKAGYINKKWDVAGPVGFKADQSMLQTGNGISIGAMGINLAHQLKIIVGVGVHGFAVGPFFNFTSAVGMFQGSSLGMIPCREATLNVKVNGGVGYVIPKSIVRLINSVLRALNIRYEINSEGSITPSTPLTVLNASNALKGCHAGGA